MTPTSVKMEAEEKVKVEALAKKEDRSQHWIIKTAIKIGLKYWDKEKKK